MKKFITAFFSCIMMLLYTGCSLLPVEEETLIPPVIKPYESAQFSTFKVTIGDIQLWKTVRFSYVPTYTETLSFSVGGLYYDSVLVTEGDEVETGDIIASLDCADLDASITDIEKQLEDIAIARANDAELRPLDERAARVAGTLEEVSQGYIEKEKDRRHNESILNIRLERQKKNRAKRILVAGMDGIITYVRKVKDGELSVSDSRFAVITDKSHSVFTYTGEDFPLFAAGSKIDISVGDDVFSATVVTAEELEINNPKPDTVYAALDQTNMTIKENATGLTEVLIGEAKNVLFIPTGAIHTVRDRLFVYLIVDGVRVTSDITVGLDNGKFIEITGGLSEGDEIITGG